MYEINYRLLIELWSDICNTYLCNVYYISFISFNCHTALYYFNNLKLMQLRIVFVCLLVRTITFLTSPTRNSYQHISREASTGRGRNTRPAVESAKVSSGRNYRVFPATRWGRCARRIVISNTAGCNVISCVCTTRNMALSALQIVSWC